MCKSVEHHQSITHHRHRRMQSGNVIHIIGQKNEFIFFKTKNSPYFLWSNYLPGRYTRKYCTFVWLPRYHYHYHYHNHRLGCVCDCELWLWTLTLDLWLWLLYCMTVNCELSNCELWICDCDCGCSKRFRTGYWAHMVVLHTGYVAINNNKQSFFLFSSGFVFFILLYFGQNLVSHLYLFHSFIILSFLSSCHSKAVACN